MAIDGGRALVTGASAGIGAALARELAARGHDVVLVARDEARLDALAKELRDRLGTRTEVLPADLCDPDGLVRVETRLRAEPAIDVLVNNAGFGLHGALVEQPVDELDSMIRLNALALARCAHAAGAAMSARRKGGILNVASIAAVQPVPQWTAYGATKAFVVSFSRALRTELRPSGVHVTALLPGFTRTEFHDRGAMDVSGLPGFLWHDPPRVAREGLDALERNRAVCVPGLANRAAAVGARFAPYWLTRRVMALIDRGVR
jgi:hypothetical protein